MRRRHYVVLFVILLWLPTLSGCRTRSFLSTKQEIELGKEGAREVEQEFRIDTTSPDAERVRKIGESLLPHMDRRDVPYSFKVLISNQINAFSLPGGPVYVFRGLLDLVGNDNSALACVIGHECGHINARHVARHISTDIIHSALISILFPNANVQNAVGLVDQIIQLKYSRDDEYEADWRGLSYAYYAGYDPNGLIRFFHKLELVEKWEGGNNTPEWLQDHPLTPERIRRAEWIIAHHDYRYGH